MNPIESITKEVKAKSGKNIVVTIESFKDAVVKTEDGEKFHTMLSFTDKKTKTLLGRMPFPKANRELLNKQMEITISNIDDYLDVISKG
jgi:hypothetical protein